MGFKSFFLILAFLFCGIKVPASEVQIPSQLAPLELKHQIEFKSSAVEAFYFSPDLSRVLLISKKVKLTDDSQKGQFVPIGNWKLYQSQKSDYAVFSKGLNEKQILLIVRGLESSKSSAWLRFFLGEKAYADECAVKVLPEEKAQLDGQNILGKISVENAVKNCNFDIVQMLKDALKSVIESVTQFEIPTLAKISQTIDSLYQGLTSLTTDLNKYLRPLIEKAPQIIEGMICELVKTNVPGLVTAAVIPGGFRRLPFQVARIVDDVKDFVKSPEIIKLIETSDIPMKTQQAVPILVKLTHANPDVMKKVNIQPGNFEQHYNKHSREAPHYMSREAYRQSIEDLANASSSNVISHCRPNGTCGKLNIETGDYLVVAKDRNFVSLHKLEGNSKNELFTSFLLAERKHFTDP